ncbi:hypothetical protein B0H10DRAFT_2051713 [Mycena sp. CBHHK59/15]|nr:hypothetical protein B0H10DRAFT_2051713 [Mycena sp. CBHHK59/15]
MSSTQAGTPTASPLPTPNQLASGTNYFFGFLIAFIAFLFLFLSLGLLARRRRMQLQQEFLLYGSDDDLLPQTEPLMWQPTYTEAKGQLWSAIMPLSSAIHMREASPPRPTRNPFVVYFGFPAMKPSRKGPRRIKASVPEALQVAVMINMPKSPEVYREDDRKEYQIGTLQLPWKVEDFSGTR